uniref:Uncharacterized protein n=1 Tax=Timema shepardi TaxID=629360 RepID=A0A7R9B0L0_TIMSH|nr:unnamed protein product [Timema shepardi]
MVGVVGLGALGADSEQWEEGAFDEDIRGKSDESAMADAGIRGGVARTRGLPDFMSRLRQAAREFYSLRKSNPKFVTALESKHQPEKNPTAFTPDTVASPPSPPTTDPQKDGPYFQHFQGMKLFL